MTTSRAARPRDRAEPREVVQLRTLRTEHPELAPAIDLQIELLDIHRRVLPRISLPAALLGADAPSLRTDGKPVLTWDMVPLDLSEFRAVLRETLDALLRSGDIEAADAQFLTGLARDGNRLPAFIEAWFRDRVEQTTARVATSYPGDAQRVKDPVLDNALTLSFRPFLSRCADAVGPRLDVVTWHRGTCPLCGGEPEIGIVGEDGDRRLVCSRCSLRWPFSENLCPWCENTNPLRLRTFTSPDRRYRLTACDACLRYVKSYDERHAPRPSMPGVDAIAMLPLDVLAIQRGYAG